MSLLTFVSPSETSLNTEILDQKDISRKTRRQIEKIGNRALKSIAKGETDISAAPNWFDAWKQNTLLKPETAELVEEVLDANLAMKGLAAHVERTYHDEMAAEDRIVVIPANEIAAHTPENSEHLVA